MRVLGLSGLNRAVSYKKKILPNADPRLVRLVQGMDSAAALIEDGVVVAAVAEERLNRQKHSNLLPVQAIEWCLSEAGMELADVDKVAFCFDYSEMKDLYSLTASGKAWYENVYAPDVLEADLAAAFGSELSEKLTLVPHHFAHAASAFLPSGFTRALTIVADGMGEVDGVTIFDSTGTELKKVRSVAASDSIGILYGLITLHLGFSFNYDEYKTMGLAPYGDWTRYWPIFEEWLSLDDDGGTYGLDFIQNEDTEFARETYERTRESFASLFFPPRGAEDPIEQEHMDLAASVQEVTNRVMGHLVKYWSKKLDHDAVCLAGGVALNCVSNQHVLGLSGIRSFFVQPASADDGAALGAAMYVAATSDRIEQATVPYWGPGSHEDQLREAFDEEHIAQLDRHEHPTLQDGAHAIAGHIADGKVVAVYHGRMEFGPRALGNRSILADPRNPSMRDRVNAAVKKRESFRPFAPAVLEDQLSTYFDPPVDGDYSYMLVTMPVRVEYREELPAITHVNGSARPQTVNADQNQYFHSIIGAFFDLTGMPIVLNTSFNVKGQPIVHTPFEAVRTFINTGIDSLFLGRYELTKSRPS